MMKLTYTEKDGLLFPNLELDEQPEGTIGKYGRMRKRYLEQKHDGTFTSLVLSGKLTEHLLEIDHTAGNNSKPQSLKWQPQKVSPNS